MTSIVCLDTLSGTFIISFIYIVNISGVAHCVIFGICVWYKSWIEVTSIDT